MQGQKTEKRVSAYLDGVLSDKYVLEVRVRISVRARGRGRARTRVKIDLGGFTFEHDVLTLCATGAQTAHGTAAEVFRLGLGLGLGLGERMELDRASW